MKKKIFLGLLLGALSFGSCVKDNESEAVKKQREAQAEFLLSEANLKNKQAEVQAAEAKIKVAQADLEIALRDVKVKAATATATKLESETEVQLKEAEVSIASATLAKEKLMATFAAEVEKEKSKVEGIKIERVQNLVSAVSSATTIYGKTYSEVVSKQKEITNTEIEIAKLEAGVTTATKARDREIAKQDDKIKAAEIKIAALKEAIETNFTSLDKLRENLSNKEYEVKNAKAALDGEEAKVDAFNTNTVTSEYVKAKDALEYYSKQLSNFEFVKSLKQAYDLATSVYSDTTVPDAMAPNQRTGAGTGFKGLKLLESDGTRKVSGITVNKFKPVVDTKEALQAQFFSEPHADAVLNKLKLKVSDAEKETKSATASVTTAQAKYTAAQASLTADTQSQTLIDRVQSATEALANAKAKKAEKEKELNKQKKNQKDFEDAVKAIKDSKNQEPVLAALKKFSTQKTELESKLDELQKLVDKYNTLSNEKAALESSVNNVVSAVASGASGTDGVERLRNAIEEAEKEKEKAEVAKQTYSKITTAEQLLDAEREKLKQYKAELEILKGKLEAATKVYESALNALKEAMKSSSNS